MEEIKRRGRPKGSLNKATLLSQQQTKKGSGTYRGVCNN